MQYALNRRIARDRVPMEVLRGFEPTEPGKLSLLAPPIDGEAIRSGMVIVRDTGLVNGVSRAGAFRKALSTDAVGTAGNESLSYYLALHDQDSHDVQASGGIIGLDCSDDYEVQTGYFVKGSAFALNSPLSVDTGGLVKIAATTENIIGYVTRLGTGTANSIAYAGKTLPTANAANAEVLQFKTARNGQRKI